MLGIETIMSENIILSGENSDLS